MGSNVIPADYHEAAPRVASRQRRPRSRFNIARGLLITIALVYLAIFLGLPLVVVFTQALSKGLQTYVAALNNPAALSAIKLTALVLPPKSVPAAQSRTGRTAEPPRGSAAGVSDARTTQSLMPYLSLSRRAGGDVVVPTNPIPVPPRSWR